MRPRLSGFLEEAFVAHDFFSTASYPASICLELLSLFLELP